MSTVSSASIAAGEIELSSSLASAAPRSLSPAAFLAALSYLFAGFPPAGGVATASPSAKTTARSKPPS